MNVKKIMIMVKSRDNKPVVNTMLNGQYEEQVQKFKYLYQMITGDNVPSKCDIMYIHNHC